MLGFITRMRFCLLVLASSVHRATAYFIVQSPNANTVWKNGGTVGIRWTKGVMDGIDFFDLELTQRSQDGLSLIARNIPNSISSLNLFLQDVPPGDDYYLFFMNYTHGAMHATSQKFTLLSATNSSSASSDSSAIASAPTVTVSGAPNPTLQSFATTMVAVRKVNTGSSLHTSSPHRTWRMLSVAAGSLTVAALSGLSILW